MVAMLGRAFTPLTTVALERTQLWARNHLWVGFVKRDDSEYEAPAFGCAVVQKKVYVFCG